MIDQRGGVHQKTVRITDVASRTQAQSRSAGDEIVDDDREEALRPLGMNAATARVVFLAPSLDALAALQHRDLVASDALIGKVADVLRVVKQRHGIVVGL